MEKEKEEKDKMEQQDEDRGMKSRRGVLLFPAVGTQ